MLSVLHVVELAITQANAPVRFQEHVLGAGVNNTKLKDYPFPTPGIIGMTVQQETSKEASVGAQTPGTNLNTTPSPVKEFITSDQPYMACFHLKKGRSKAASDVDG